MMLNASSQGAMRKQHERTWLTLHVFISLLTHLAQLALSTLLALTLHRDLSHRDLFFSLIAGLITLPLVTLHLISAIFLLRGQGDSMTGKEVAVKAGLHVLQLGFLCRHLELLRPGKDSSARRRDLKELLLLGLTFTLTGGLPLVLLQLYLTLTGVDLGGRSWTLPASLAACALSCAWSVASYHPPREPGMRCWWCALNVLLWRAGELTSRVICLAMFVCVYRQWLVVVVAAHWVVMMICVALPQSATTTTTTTTTNNNNSNNNFKTNAITSTTTVNNIATIPPCTTLATTTKHGESSWIYRLLSKLVTSYCFVWCYIITCDVRKAVWYTVYYVIMFVENGALCIVWLTKTEADNFGSRYLPVVISAVAFLMAMACVSVHHRYCPTHSCRCRHTSEGLGHTAKHDSVQCCCPSCDRNHSDARREKILSLPARWTELRPPVLTCGQYEERSAESSLLYSPSDCFLTNTKRSTTLGPLLSSPDTGDGEVCSVLSGQSWRSSCPSCSQQSQALSCCMSHSTHSTSLCTLGSRASHHHGYQGYEDTQSSRSVYQHAWLPPRSSLTSTRGTPSHTTHTSALATPAVYMPTQGPQGCRRKESRVDSDGYSTDHTVLEWSKIPVTPLGANVWHIDDPDTDCCCPLATTDSEGVSSIRGPHGEQERSCDECCGDSVYGIPRQVFHPPWKGIVDSVSSLGCRSTCSCGVQQDQIIQNDQRHYSSVFTISPQRSCCASEHSCRASDVCNKSHSAPCMTADSDRFIKELYRTFQNNKKLDKSRCRNQASKRSNRLSTLDVYKTTPNSKLTENMSTSLCRNRVREIMDKKQVSKRDHQRSLLDMYKMTPSSKHAVNGSAGHRNNRLGESIVEEKQHEGQALSRSNRYNQFSMYSGTLKSQLTEKVSTTPGKMRPGDVQSDSHIPSKLQVKAIAERSIHNGAANVIASTEPVYENVLDLATESYNHFNALKTSSVTANGSPLKRVRNSHLNKAPQNQNIGIQESYEKQQKKRRNAPNLHNKQTVIKIKELQTQTTITGPATRSDSAARKEIKVRSSKSGDHCLQRLSDRFRDRWYGGQESVYGVSESEDSAVPSDALSSSLDDVFPVPDSDGSVELVI